IPTPNIIHQDIKATLFRSDSTEQSPNIVFDSMVGSNVNADAAACRNHFSRFFDSFRAISACRVAANTATTAIDNRTSFAKRAGNAAPSPASCTGNDSDSSFQRFHADSFDDGFFSTNFSLSDRGVNKVGPANPTNHNLANTTNCWWSFNFDLRR